MEHYFTNNENLESKLKIIEYKLKDTNFKFYSDLGVFSKDRIDYGSRLLIETFLSFPDKKNMKILDVGCGYGLIGTVLSKLTDSQSTMIDINKRCVHLTEMNIKGNKVNAKVFLSNIYENVDDKYDLVITNPPIRAGKNIVLEILLKAKEHLNDNGELWFVIKKDHGAKSVIKCLENDYLCEIKEKNKGFYIVCAQIR